MAICQEQILKSETIIKIVFYLTKNRNRAIILNIGRNSKKSKCRHKNIDACPKELSVRRASHPDARVVTKGMKPDCDTLLRTPNLDACVEVW